MFRSYSIEDLLDDEARDFGSETCQAATKMSTPLVPGLEARIDDAPESRHATTRAQAVVALFKAIVGPGLLFLPAAVKNAGLVSAAFVTLVAASFSIYCMLLTIDCASILRRRGVSVCSMGDIGYAAFGIGGKVAVEAAIITSQLGFCTAYCVFIAENTQSIIFEIYGGIIGEAGEGKPCELPGLLADESLVYYIIVVIILPLAPLTWVRQLKYFSATNLVASLLVVTSVAYLLLAFAVRLAQEGPAQNLRLYDFSGTLVYFGTAMYAFEGIGVLLPLERSMANPAQLPGVVIFTMTGACLLQVGFAVVAYTLYGQTTTSIITIALSIGHFSGGTFGVILVQLAWITEVLLTFPLQLFPAARILESVHLAERLSGRKWLKNGGRSALVLLCILVSTFGYRSVDNLISLIGALGCVPLNIVYPALFHYKICYSQMASSGNGIEHHICIKPFDRVRQCIDVAFCVLGVMGVLLATSLAISSWAQSTFTFKSCVMRV